MASRARQGQQKGKRSGYARLDVSKEDDDDDNGIELSNVRSREREGDLLAVYCVNTPQMHRWEVRQHQHQQESIRWVMQSTLCQTHNFNLHCSLFLRLLWLLLLCMNTESVHESDPDPLLQTKKVRRCTATHPPSYSRYCLHTAHRCDWPRTYIRLMARASLQAPLPQLVASVGLCNG